jgi:hypothetical protein
MSTTIDTWFKAELAFLAQQHGGYSAVPKQQEAHLAELMRAKYVLSRHPDEPPALALRRYQVMPDVIRELTGELPADMPTKKPKRTEKYEAIISWCKENAGTEVTLYEVAEVGGVSYTTATKFAADRPDLLLKVKRGIYVLRNPDHERAEKR